MEKGIPIRQPSTANLLIDSFDNNTAGGQAPNASMLQVYDFTIQKRMSILNGFFTRIAVSELCLEWFVPNIHGAYTNGGYDGNANNTLTFSATGVASVVITITEGNYTVNDLLEAVTKALTTACTGVTITWTLGVVQRGYTGSGTILIHQQVGIVPSGSIAGCSFSGPIADLLGLPVFPTTYNATNPIYITDDVDLRPYRYLDFTSPQLTYTQALKDSSTSTIVRDVLVRWYFAWDTAPDRDGLGFPILMGYLPFTLRRTFNPPKQIRWEPNLPIGNLGFQVYGDDGQLATLMVKSYPTSIIQQGCNWLMTLQVSEV